MKKGPRFNPSSPILNKYFLFKMKKGWVKTQPYAIKFPSQQHLTYCLFCQYLLFVGRGFNPSSLDLSAVLEIETILLHMNTDLVSTLHRLNHPSAYNKDLSPI